MALPADVRRAMDRRFYLAMIGAVGGFPERLPATSIGQWAEERRVLPQGISPIPGPYRWSVTPYLREIADCLSESSTVQRLAIMKGARLGFTVGIIKNWVGYVIDVAPGPMLFVSGDKETAESVIELRLDRMIESSGLTGRIFPPTVKAHGKKTGDTKSRKDFAGGFLMAIGPNVGAKLRTHGIRYLAFDEVDAYPAEVRAEGDPIALAERRTDEFEAIRKILYLSTPAVEQASRIKPLFETGDQRYYHVPCRHCGVQQILRWPQLKYETDDAGRLIWESVHYECEKCGGAWKNSDKAIFLGQGEWRATAQAQEPRFRSYHLSALYSPVGFRSWESICQEWLKVHKDPMMLRVFLNTVLGECYQERGEAPEHERIMLRREQYTAGTLPPTARPYFLTCGVDVQENRLEAEIVAWGIGFESWSVEYLTLHGQTDNVESESWSQLKTVLESEHAGMRIELALIDAHHNAPAVNTFCSKYKKGVMPLLGDSRVGRYQKLFLKRDAVGFTGMKRIDLFAAPLKTELYNYLRQGPPAEGQPFPPGYCHFPIDRSEKYFRGLVAEELVRTRTRTGAWKTEWVIRGGRANEPHDCRIYAMAAVHVLADQVREDYGVEELSWDDFWKWCEIKLKPKITGEVSK